MSLHVASDPAALSLALQNAAATYVAEGSANAAADRQLAVLCVGVAALRLFVQANWTGPALPASAHNILFGAECNEVNMATCMRHCAIHFRCRLPTRRGR